MSHAENKVEWCMRKAEREIIKSGKHRGLLKNQSRYKQSEGTYTKSRT